MTSCLAYPISDCFIALSNMRIPTPSGFLVFQTSVVLGSQAVICVNDDKYRLTHFSDRRALLKNQFKGSIKSLTLIISQKSIKTYLKDNLITQVVRHYYSSSNGVSYSHAIFTASSPFLVSRISTFGRRRERVVTCW